MNFIQSNEPLLAMLAAVFLIVVVFIVAFIYLIIVDWL